MPAGHLRSVGRATKAGGAPRLRLEVTTGRGHTGSAAGVFTVGDLEPAGQTGLGDPEASRDLRDRLATLAGNRDDVATELLGIRSGHSSDPSSEGRSLTGKESTQPWAVPHVVVDNYATRKHPAVRAWLARHRRVHLHFTPTPGSWLNLVEAFFSIITRQTLRRGSFPTVADLIAAIGRFIDAWNDRCAPFTWTKDPDTVVAKATHPRQRKTPTASDTDH
jgi:hypothetical protein